MLESSEYRAQRWAEGRASPTGWPVRRVRDDGITTPRRSLHLVPPPAPHQRPDSWQEWRDHARSSLIVLIGCAMVWATAATLLILFLKTT